MKTVSAILLCTIFASCHLYSMEKSSQEQLKSYSSELDASSKESNATLNQADVWKPKARTFAFRARMEEAAAKRGARAEERREARLKIPGLSPSSSSDSLGSEVDTAPEMAAYREDDEVLKDYSIQDDTTMLAQQKKFLAEAVMKYRVYKQKGNQEEQKAQPKSILVHHSTSPLLLPDQTLGIPPAKQPVEPLIITVYQGPNSALVSPFGVASPTDVGPIDQTFESLPKKKDSPTPQASSTGQVQQNTANGGQEEPELDWCSC